MIYTLVIMVTVGGFLQEHETTKYSSKAKCDEYLYALEAKTETLKLKHTKIELECRPSKPIPLS